MERQEMLRKLVFVYAHDAKGGAGNHFDFDALCEQVLEYMERASEDRLKPVTCGSLIAL
jgi:hypothetical protein